jgi:hypothetical protein
MVVLPKDFKVGAGRLTLGVMFDPSQPFIGKPNLINSSFGPGNPMDNFQHFFKVSFRDAVLRNSLFSRVVFTDDSLGMKSKGFSYRKNYLEMKVPLEKLDRFVSDGIDYLMIVQKLTLDIVGSANSDLSTFNRRRHGKMMIDHLGEENNRETFVNYRLKLSAKVLIVNCSNDSVITFGNVITDNSAADLSRSDWTESVNEFVEEIFEGVPFGREYEKKDGER